MSRPEAPGSEVPPLDRAVTADLAATAATAAVGAATANGAATAAGAATANGAATAAAIANGAGATTPAAAAAAEPTSHEPPRPGRTRFGPALRNAEFRSMWFADTVSAIGSQISRVALSLLVFQETGSALASAAIFALTFLPTLIGGALLSGLADRIPRRGLMVGLDIARTVLVASMALPFLSLTLTAVILFVAVLLDSPFRAAQTALLPLVLEGEAYEVGMALRTITLQAAQLIGYGLGGLLVAVTSPRIGLAIDAVTFLVGAAVVRFGVHSRAVPERARRHDNAVRDYLQGMTAGVGTIARSPSLRVFVGLALLSGVYVVPEGLAAPYAASIGAGSAAVGVLMASDSAGSALGAWLLMRFVPEQWRFRSMAAMAMLPGLILLAMLGRPGLAVSVVVWTFAGIFSVFQIPASVAFVREVPDSERGQAMGLVISAMLTAQGVGVLLGGVVAEAADATTAIVVFAVFGIACGAWLTFSWSRTVRLGPAVTSFRHDS